MPVVSDRWEVLKCGDSMIKPNTPSQILSSCLYAQLSICAIALRLLTNFSPSHVKILFYTIRLNPSSSSILYHDRISMIVPWFTSFVEDFVICCYQVTKLFCPKYCFANEPPARNPCYFGSQADIAISVFWEVSKNTVLLRFRFRCLRIDLILENNVRVHAILFLSEFLWNALTSQEDMPTVLSNPSCHSSFYFGFEFLGMAPVPWLRVRHFALRLNLKMNLKQVAQVPWVLVPPLSSASPVVAMQKATCFQERWRALELSWSLSHSKGYPWSSQSLLSERTAGVSSSNCTVTNRLRSWTNTWASSWVCISPLAVNTTVGVLDFFTVSISPELYSFLLIMCIDAPESTTNSRSSDLVEVGADITFASIGEKKDLFEFLSL